MDTDSSHFELLQIHGGLGAQRQRAHPLSVDVIVVMLMVVVATQPRARGCFHPRRIHVCWLSTRTTSTSARVARSMAACGLQAWRAASAAASASPSH